MNIRYQFKVIVSIRYALKVVADKWERAAGIGCKWKWKARGGELQKR